MVLCTRGREIVSFTYITMVIYAAVAEKSCSRTVVLQMPKTRLKRVTFAGKRQ